MLHPFNSTVGTLSRGGSFKYRMGPAAIVVYSSGSAVYVESAGLNRKLLRHGLATAVLKLPPSERTRAPVVQENLSALYFLLSSDGAVWPPLRCSLIAGPFCVAFLRPRVGNTRRRTSSPIWVHRNAVCIPCSPVYMWGSPKGGTESSGIGRVKHAFLLLLEFRISKHPLFRAPVP